MNIKGLVFDLDGVISETAILHFKAWKIIVKKYSINYTEDVNSGLKGLSRQDTLRGIFKHYGVLDKFTEKEITDISNVKNDIYKDLLNKEISKKDILPGIKDLLDDAKKLNLKMAIASSSYNAPMILEKTGLLSYFDFIVNPGDLKNGKPDSEIFIRAYKGLGLTSNEVIGFEDAMPGVVGLKDAGIMTVAITHGYEGDWEKADLVYEKTSELKLKNIINI